MSTSAHHKDSLSSSSHSANSCSAPPQSPPAASAPPSPNSDTDPAPDPSTTPAPIPPQQAPPTPEAHETPATPDPHKSLRFERLLTGITYLGMEVVLCFVLSAAVTVVDVVTSALVGPNGAVLYFRGTNLLLLLVANACCMVRQIK